MAHREQPSPAHSTVKTLVAAVAKRHGITPRTAGQLILRFMRRAKQNRSADGWWAELLDAQFQTRIGPYKRVRCGAETQLSHLTPEAAGLCHDCVCARGEYHVFGCDAEECSNCGGQAFCCDCRDDSDPEDKSSPSLLPISPLQDGNP